MEEEMVIDANDGKRSNEHTKFESMELRGMIKIQKYFLDFLSFFPTFARTFSTISVSFCVLSVWWQ